MFHLQKSSDGHLVTTAQGTVSKATKRAPGVYHRVRKRDCHIFEALLIWEWLKVQVEVPPSEAARWALGDNSARDSEQHCTESFRAVLQASQTQVSYL